MQLKKNIIQHMVSERDSGFINGNMQSIIKKNTTKPVEGYFDE